MRPGPKKGTKQSLEHRKKVSIAKLLRKKKLGYINSPETRIKMSIAKKGKKGNPQTPYGKSQISKAQKGRRHFPQQGFQRGEKNPAWQNGKAYEIYPVDWNKTLKRSIRERDRYICQLCGKPQEDIAHDVHHIDYNKKNCNPSNLITLCKSCHVKTNFNRQNWIIYFKNDKK